MLCDLLLISSGLLGIGFVLLFSCCFLFVLAVFFNSSFTLLFFKEALCFFLCPQFVLFLLGDADSFSLLFFLLLDGLTFCLLSDDSLQIAKLFGQPVHLDANLRELLVDSERFLVVFLPLKCVAKCQVGIDIFIIAFDRLFKSINGLFVLRSDVV